MSIYLNLLNNCNQSKKNVEKNFLVSIGSKLEELTSMTKDGAKRVKELEKEKKSLEQRNAQFEKVFYLLMLTKLKSP